MVLETLSSSYKKNQGNESFKSLKLNVTMSNIENLEPIIDFVKKKMANLV